MIFKILGNTYPYITVFAAALVLTLILTPIVREMNRQLGMVDKPDPRRINKIPIPRGGGIALFIGVAVAYTAFRLTSGFGSSFSFTSALSGYWRILAISFAIVAVGYIDDRWSLPPKVKLAGQLACALATWWWAGLGFSNLWSGIPPWLDCAMTVFWIAGAINAFNLIDGLDGLASGIALIASLGMAGTLFIIGAPSAALFHIAFAGGLLGFLRYNYHPASVFLGDSGSMYIGYTLAVLPLAAQTPNSLLVSVGVPMLAMGVPIFDTSLAIIRRSIRHMIRKRDISTSGSDEVMTADSDHLHHRILRSVGLNQRKAAWTLYLATTATVGIGLIAMTLKSRAAGLWLVAVAVGSFAVFKNMARIELYDAGRLLSSVAHDPTKSVRRLLWRIAMPLYLVGDLTLLFLTQLIFVHMRMMEGDLHNIRMQIMVRVVSLFLCLFLFDTYRTVWARAMLSNFIRLLIACAFGSLIGGAVVLFFLTAPGESVNAVILVTICHGLLAFIALATLRLFRPILRDVFYAVDCSSLKGRKDISRILVYGAGLRYRTFRREMVRATTANSRMIVGILDDNILMRKQFIGGIRVEGTIHEAPEIINRLNVDTVVIACVLTPERLKIVRSLLAPTGVKLSLFTFSETLL